MVLNSEPAWDSIPDSEQDCTTVGETRCRLDLPHDLPSRPLPPEVRHNIFLIVKEALTNALKHARAKEVRVSVKASSDAMKIMVRDDGGARRQPGRDRRRLPRLQLDISTNHCRFTVTTGRVEQRLLQRRRLVVVDVRRHFGHHRRMDLAGIGEYRGRALLVEHVRAGELADDYMSGKWDNPVTGPYKKA